MDKTTSWTPSKTQFQMVQSSTWMMFHSSKTKKSKYTEFIGKLKGIIFIATKRGHEFLLNQKGNASNMSKNLNIFRKVNVNKNSSNLILAPTNHSDKSHPTYSQK